MELWIRTQDREIIKKCSFIEMHELIENEDYILQDNEIDYGRYKTHERALEVLDEIQGKITQNECLKTMIPKLNNVKGEEEKIGKLFKDMVYEMPKE